MNLFRFAGKLGLSLLIAGAAFSWTSPCFAEPAPAPHAAQGGAANNPAQAAAAAIPAGVANNPVEAGNPAESPPAPPEDPAVAAVLATNPLTPRERIRAATVLLDLGRADLAKQMLAAVLKSPLDDAALLALSDEFGSATFFRLGSRIDLTPEGSELAKLVFDAVRRHRTDPLRLAQLVQDLCSAPGDGWYVAAKDLMQTGDAALPFLCEALLDPTKRAAWSKVCYVLGQLRPDSEQALISLLLSVPDSQKATVIETLSALQVRDAVWFVIRTAVADDASPAIRVAARQAVLQFAGELPTPRQAARMLVVELQRTLGMSAPPNGGVMSLLEWNASTGRLSMRQVSFELWRRERAAHLAEDAAQLSPDDPPLRARALALRLEEVGYRHHVEWGERHSSEGKSTQPDKVESESTQGAKSGGQAAPLAELAKHENEAAGGAPGSAQDAASGQVKTGTNGPTVIAQQSRDQEQLGKSLSAALAGWNPSPEDINDALDACLREKWYHGAWAASVLLGEFGDPQLLPGDQVPVLVKALSAPDEDVRFAALEAILKLSPGGVFRGSSAVLAELMYFARSEGVDRVLIADISPARATQMAALAKAAGFDRADIVFDGKSLLEKAADSPDYVVAFVSAAIQGPSLDLTLQRLRADPRLGSVPLVVYGDADWLPLADRVTRDIPGTVSVARPENEQEFAALVARSRMLPDVNRQEAGVRLERARRAMAWLVSLVEQPGVGISREELEATAVRALAVPDLREMAIDVLAELATPKAQTQLVEVASRSDWPLPQRVKALGAFRRTVEKRGVQLTTAQILRQYDRYNESTQEAAESRQVLTLILDCIEAPTQWQKEKTVRAK